jgi:CRP-like cAMP-binding protein
VYCQPGVLEPERDCSTCPCAAVSTTMYVIKSGEVTVSAFPKAEVDSSSKYPTQRRRVFNLGVIGAGQWFGERPLLTGEKNDFTYTSATPVTLFSINQKLFVQLGKHVTAALIKELTTKLQFR